MKQIFRLTSMLFGGQKGETPVAAGVPINVRGDTTVFKSIATPVIDSKDVGEKLPLENIIKEGRMMVPAILAHRILDEASVPWQRRITKHHVALFVDALRRGTYYPSQVTFCWLGGRLLLVNGYHRMTALTETGGSMEVQVLILDVETEAEVRAHYHRFDVIERKRTTSESLNALNVNDDYGISKRGATAAYGAVGLIINNFRHLNYQQDPVKARSVDKRIDAARPWWPFMAEFEGLTKSAPTAVRAKLFNHGCTAVALVTLRYQPQKAREFWHGLAENDGLAKGDPRSTLLLDMFNRQLKSGAQNQAALTAALAWNAWFHGQRRTILKVAQNAKIRIAGTPFDGSRG